MTAPKYPVKIFTLVSMNMKAKVIQESHEARTSQGEVVRRALRHYFSSNLDTLRTKEEWAKYRREGRKYRREDKK